jgi:hypothetical protein
MKRKISLLIAITMLLTLFSACSAGLVNHELASSMAGGSPQYDFAEESGGVYNRATVPQPAPGSAGELRDSVAERKIIWNASMDIEAEDAAGLHERLASRAAALGGYEYANEIRHYEGYSVVHATYKVPPESLRAFMEYAGQEGKIVNSILSSDDVTEGYYDAQIRLDTKRKSLERYYELLAEAESVEAILQLQRIIDGITEEIEALEGRLRMWDVLTDMATVRVTIRQQNDPVTLKREIVWSALTIDDMGYLIQSGFVTVTGAAVTVLQWLLIVLLVSSPLWLLVLILLWFFWWRPRRKRRAAAKSAEEPRPPADL